MTTNRVNRGDLGDMEGLSERERRTMTDPQRMLWRDDVEGICRSPEICWGDGERVRCGPCAIQQAERAGIVSDLSVPNLPEVYRLRRELARLAQPPGSVRGDNP